MSSGVITRHGGAVHESDVQIFGNNLTVYGDRCIVKGDNCIIYGVKCKVYGNHCTVAERAIGCEVVGNDAIVKAPNCRVTGKRARAEANKCSVTGNDAIVTGSNCRVEGSGCTVRGRANYVKCDRSKVFGSNNVVEGKRNTVVGDGNTISGQLITATGDRNTITGIPRLIKGAENVFKSTRKWDGPPPDPDEPIPRDPHIAADYVSGVRFPASKKMVCDERMQPSTALTNNMFVYTRRGWCVDSDDLPVPRGIIKIVGTDGGVVFFADDAVPNGHRPLNVARSEDGTFRAAHLTVMVRGDDTFGMKAYIGRLSLNGTWYATDSDRRTTIRDGKVFETADEDGERELDPATAEPPKPQRRLIDLNHNDLRAVGAAGAMAANVAQPQRKAVSYVSGFPERDDKDITYGTDDDVDDDELCRGCEERRARYLLKCGHRCICNKCIYRIFEANPKAKCPCCNKIIVQIMEPDWEPPSS